MNSLANTLIFRRLKWPLCNFAFALAILVIASFYSGAARAQSVDEVIAKNIQAHGGLEKLKSVANYSHHGKIRAGPDPRRILTGKQAT